MCPRFLINYKTLHLVSRAAGLMEGINHPTSFSFIHVPSFLKKYSFHRLFSEGNIATNNDTVFMEIDAAMRYYCCTGKGVKLWHTKFHSV